MSREAEPTISVIIPTLNEEPALGATLDVVRKLSGRFEILVVDGGSSDETPTIAKSRDCRDACQFLLLSFADPELAQIHH